MYRGLNLPPHQPLFSLNHQSQPLPTPLPTLIHPTSHPHLPQPSIQIQLLILNQLICHRTQQKAIHYSLPPVYQSIPRQNSPPWIVFSATYNVIPSNTVTPSILTHSPTHLMAKVPTPFTDTSNTDIHTPKTSIKTKYTFRNLRKSKLFSYKD